MKALRLFLPALLISCLTLPAYGKPLLKSGSQGVDVLEVQALLQLLGYYEGELDGTYNSATEKSISAFQKTVGLTPDGILGPSTWSKLLPSSPTETTAEKTKPTTTPKSAPKSESSKSSQPNENTATPILRKGAKGDAVYRLQKRLVKLGFLGITPDGDFGALTEQAVKDAQKNYKLETDGVVGGATWNAIGL